jgi:hypothetical protein
MSANDPTLKPASFLGAQPLVLEDGRPNPVVNGQLCPAALRAFDQAELSPQELETFVEALRRLLPMQDDGEPSERFAAAVDSALDLIARVLNKEPNPVIEDWAMEFVPFIESDADAQAALVHWQNALALYAAFAHLKYG